MLLLLPRFSILCRNKLGSEGIQLAVRFFDLGVHKADAGNERLDVGAGGFGRTGSNLHRRFAQHIQHMGSIEAPDAIALQQFAYRPLADARGLAGRGRKLPQLKQPCGANVFFEFLHGGVTLLLRYRASRYLSAIAPKLLAKAVGKPVALRAKIACDAGPLAQLDNSGIEGRQQPEAVRVGTQGGGHYFGVAAVILGSGQREAVPEAIYLFRVDGVDR